ncbi:hypothetical protein V565_141980 [Rhizoctonia solani 123E]|uniref:Uncharacterized protein n=1 Tax=Rhizoctonia solani 123E TaxID=1423351 RepID=A0A074RRA9_9AGAM|nr:hypothetical protein V565_141980 [Rhizoctonia solani 123E]
MQANHAHFEHPPLKHEQLVNDRSGDVQADNVQAQKAKARNLMPERPQLVLGQRIMATMYIPTGALPPSLKSSNTRQKIERGEQVRKLAYVLEINENDIVVAYTTTFGRKKELDEHVTDINDWYPVSPAPKNGARDPLPALENETSPNPAWINVKQAIRIPRTNKIAPKVEILPPESLNLILKAINPGAKGAAGLFEHFFNFVANIWRIIDS